MFSAYDDTDPAWLPDGRIVFSSTRYPQTAEYQAAHSTELFVVNADGANLHRITSEKGGADRPLVDPLTGQIVFARWWRNNHFGTNDLSTQLCTPGFSDCQTNGYYYKDGLTINPGDPLVEPIGHREQTRYKRLARRRD